MSTSSVNWLDDKAIHDQLDSEGYAHIPNLLGGHGISEVTRLSGCSTAWSAMPSDWMGKGDVAYLANEALSYLQALRQRLFHCLVPLANRWNAELGLADSYPGSFEKFDEAFNHERGKNAYLYRLGAGDYVALQQRVGDDRPFPFQIAVLASRPGADFDGGEFVLTERRPRMQSRPAVVPLQAGDAAIICTSYRSAKGSRGFYRTDFKHAVSKVHGGTRLGLHVSFHDIDWPAN